MVKIFGEQIDSLDYITKKGVYAVIFNSVMDKVFTVHNQKKRVIK